MRFAVLTLSVALFGCNADKVAQLENENKALTAKLESVTKTKSLDLQEKCAKQAREEFKQLDFSSKGLVSFTNHYAPQLNKCFMEIRMSDTTIAPGEIITTRQVIDAFEGKLYGDYFWKTQKGKKYWEVKPYLCTVTVQSGEEKFCSSDQEFTELVKPYMEQ